MNVTKIELINFRNYNDIKIDRFTNLNIVLGANGIGKTSILEGIYIGSITKTFKYNTENYIIKEGKQFSKVKVKLFDGYKTNDLEVELSKEGKKTKINGSIIKKISDYVSNYKVIIFSPDELELIKGSPNIRRNYINISISQLYKDYLEILNHYNKLIKTKNLYLKKLQINSTTDERYLDIIDEKIANYGTTICEYRKKYVERLNFFIEKVTTLGFKKTKIKVEYESDFLNKSLKEVEKMIKRSRRNEIKNGVSAIGVHRDDLIFFHHDKNSKYFSSQGIQRLIVLVLKISEAELMINDYKLKPILLLDDLFSELDSLNQNKIFNLMNKSIQIFITTTDLKNINTKVKNKAKIFNLEEMVR